MPTCDMCGRGAGFLRRAKIEGAVLDVCDFCAGKGEVINAPGLSAPAFSKQTRDVQVVVDEVVSGFGRKIIEARQKREWEVKRLAEVLHAKESLMHKIEGEKIKPDLEFAHRIEHVLGIHIVDKAEEGEVKSANGNNGGMTLGDFIKVKKVKR